MRQRAALFVKLMVGMHGNHTRLHNPAGCSPDPNTGENFSQYPGDGLKPQKAADKAAKGGGSPADWRYARGGYDPNTGIKIYTVDADGLVWRLDPQLGDPDEEPSLVPNPNNFRAFGSGPTSCHWGEVTMPLRRADISLKEGNSSSLVLAALAALSIAALSCIRTTHGYAGACKPIDGTGNGLVSYFRALMTSGDSLRIGLQLPLVTHAEVQQVQTDSVCVRAQEALDAYIRTTTDTPSGLGPRALYVVSIGDHFAVHSPPSDPFREGVVHIFSPTWTMLEVTQY